MKPDYSKWLTPERLAEEDRLWESDYTRTWPDFIRAIERVTTWTNVRMMIEFGCGTGWVAKHISLDWFYLGVDANADCIAKAKERNPDRQNSFLCGDIRRIKLPRQKLDLSCAFSVMKHFALEEWDEVLATVLVPGRWGLFSIPIADTCFDDGTEFPHVHITEERILQAVKDADRQVYSIDPLPWGEVMVTTCPT